MAGPESTFPDQDGVPWAKLERALRLQDFVPLGPDDVHPENAPAWEAGPPTVEHVLLSADQARQWSYIIERLRHLYEGACALAIRPDDRDLLLVVGRRSDPTNPAEIDDYIHHVEWVLRNLSRAARRMKPSPQVVRELVELEESARAIDVKLPSGSNTHLKAEKFEFDLRVAGLAFGSTAARIALNLIRFRGGVQVRGRVR